MIKQGYSFGKVSSAVKSCKVTDSSNQTATDGVALTLSFDTERFDTDTMHDPCTNPERITVKTAGKYVVQGSVEFAANGVGVRSIDILINGATVLASDLHATAGATVVPVRMTVSGLYDASVDDYFTLTAFQNSGGNLNVLKTADYSPEFSAILIGT